jgi:hypothetical protein
VTLSCETRESSFCELMSCCKLPGMGGAPAPGGPWPSALLPPLLPLLFELLSRLVLAPLGSLRGVSLAPPCVPWAPLNAGLNLGVVVGE